MASETNTSAILMCDAAVDAIDTGVGTALVRIYSGAIPGTGLVDDALSGNTVLAELNMPNPAFGGAVDATPGATATANAIVDDTSANATGTATFARIFDRDNKAVLQVTAGAGAEELVLNSAAIQSGALVEILSLTMTMPEG